MNLKQKIILLVSVDSALLFVIIFLVYMEMWVEAFLALLLSLGISLWNYPVYKEYFSVKRNLIRKNFINLKKYENTFIRIYNYFLM